MLHPLLSLWRHSCRATFYDQGVSAGAAHTTETLSAGLPPMGTRRRFLNTEEAESYLRYWAADPSASAELRWVLKRCSTIPIAGATPERWLHSLAGLLMMGGVAVVEETSRRAVPGRLAPAPAAAAAAVLATLPPLAEMPAIPRPENLLPALEDLRIEGAEVLPELNQSLEQVDATIGEIATVAASVQPAPNKVPDIGDAMKAAAARAQQSIDGA